jgi:hypothetical protein
MGNHAVMPGTTLIQPDGRIERRGAGIRKQGGQNVRHQARTLWYGPRKPLLGEWRLAFGAGDQFRPFFPVLALQQRPENETDADDSGDLQDVSKLAKDGENG